MPNKTTKKKRPSGAPRKSITKRHPLTKWMDSNKITPRELSKMIGVSENLIYRWRNGDRNITSEHALLLDKITHGKVPIKELLQFRADIIQAKRREYHRTGAV